VDERKAKDDLRWQKTEEALMEAFAREVESKAVGQISVTALAKRARINKSTFYLHYSDIYALAHAYARNLADELLEDVGYSYLIEDNPRLFIRHFIMATGDAKREGRAKILRNNDLVAPFLKELTLSLYTAVKNAYQIPSNRDDLKVRATFIVNGIMGVIQFHPEIASFELMQIMDDMLLTFESDSSGAAS